MKAVRALRIIMKVVREGLVDNYEGYQDLVDNYVGCQGLEDNYEGCQGGSCG